VEPDPRSQRQAAAATARGPEPDERPRSIAIIMDGNGRWASARGLPVADGHREGARALRRTVEAAIDLEIGSLAVYAFSTENWARPRREVNALMRLIPRVIERELQELHANGVRLVHVGDLEPLDERLRAKVLDAIELTKDNDRITVNVAFNYGGRAEIVEAVKKIIEDGVKPEDLDEQLFANYLDTRGLPETDLVIRTAGEQRLSNFLLWQTAYAEYYTTPIYWPDFNVDEVEKALTEFSQRQRRFGGRD